jgi:putative nucleotidyltransferase with HDIG domain
VNQVTVALTNARLVFEVEQVNLGALTALARAIDAKSPWTAGHSERVTELALRIGRKMGLGDKDLDIIHRGGLLHDIGKIATPPGILDKPSQLTFQEQHIIREHVHHGARILEPIPAFSQIMPIILQHHERYDGKGYPNGLAGEEIYIGARIFAVADCYDAISMDRPYRPAMTAERTMEIIWRGAGSEFDPRVVKAFFEAMGEETPEVRHPEKPTVPVT